MNKKQKIMLGRIIVTTILLIALVLIGSLVKNLEWWYLLPSYIVVYLIIGYDILRKSFKGIIHGKIFDENFLMAIATIGAFALAIYQQSGDYIEALAVMLFYQIGELFQSVAVGKSRKNISALMDIRPDYANMEKDSQIVKVDPNEVEIGSIIIVNPGEKIPIDGVVVDGVSSLNTSALTGESVPRDVKVDDEIISGCINLTGVLRIRTNKAFGDSTVSKVLELVENSASRKSKSEDFISKFAKYYTPSVVICALLLAICPPVIRLIMGLSGDWGEWIYRALTFLVISCPCALVISIPLSFFAGIGGASKAGILVKGSNYMETLSKTNIVVFDKTGTLTEGVFEVNDVHDNVIEKEKIIEYAALAESHSSHPIGKSLLRAYGKEIDDSRVKNIEEISGEGINAVIDEQNVLVGNEKLMKRNNIEFVHCDNIGTIIHVAVNGEYVGHIVISDVIKTNSKEAIMALKNVGVKKTVMLTGDANKVAQSVANTIGIDEVHSELLPNDKVSKVEELINSKQKSEKLAFVGDGINDAPVLSRADIGIAMGAMGSDAAIEAADVVLMDDDPLKISKAIKISRKCLRIVWQNIIFALGVKFVCLLLGALGIANMWIAIFADVGVMILAILNAIRALRVK